MRQNKSLLPFRQQSKVSLRRYAAGHFPITGMHSCGHYVHSSRIEYTTWHRKEYNTEMQFLDGEIPGTEALFIPYRTDGRHPQLTVASCNSEKRPVEKKGREALKDTDPLLYRL